jgi:hypothetical protein
MEPENTLNSQKYMEKSTQTYKQNSDPIKSFMHSLIQQISTQHLPGSRNIVLALMASIVTERTVAHVVEWLKWHSIWAVSMTPWVQTSLSLQHLCVYWSIMFTHIYGKFLCFNYNEINIWNKSNQYGILQEKSILIFHLKSAQIWWFSFGNFCLLYPLTLFFFHMDVHLCHTIQTIALFSFHFC